MFRGIMNTRVTASLPLASPVYLRTNYPSIICQIGIQNNLSSLGMWLVFPITIKNVLISIKSGSDVVGSDSQQVRIPNGVKSM